MISSLVHRQFRARRALPLVLSSLLLGCGDDATPSTPLPSDAASDPGAPASPGPDLVDEPLAPRFDALLDSVVGQGTVGAALYVERNGRQPYRGARGLANVATGEPLAPDHLFRIASISKTYLAALLVKLAVEGRVGLTDPITLYLPESITALVPGAAEITLYEMLTMWSGIIDYRDLAFTEQVLLGDHAVVRDEYTDLTQGLARNPEPCAPPRIAVEQVTESIAGCLYSNTNYVLAGYIADQVLYGVEPAAGVRPEHHSQAFRQELFAPLGLTSTFYEKHLAPGESLGDRLAHGYYRVPSEAGEPVLTDVTGWDDGNGYANGGLISTLEEVAAFRRALFAPGDVFPMQTLAEKAWFLELLGTANPLGVAPGGALSAENWIFAGDIGGYTSWVQYSPTRDIVVAFMSNDRDLEATRGDVILAIDAILDSPSY